MFAWCAAAAAIALYLVCLARDLPGRAAIAAISATLPTIAIGIVFGIAKYGRGPDGFAEGLACVFAAFVVVTRGHTLRAVDVGFVVVPDDVRERYQQQVRRHQLLALVVGLAAWATIVVLT